ncbi:MAG: hypothetical protein ABSF33_21275 [Acidimicrobiales bacterium]|jgi:hypothetical protein
MKTRLLTVPVVAMFVIAGLVGDTSAVAGATVSPTLSVSPASGPVGSVVTVQFGPSGNGCGEPLFTPAAGYAAGLQSLSPAVGSGSEDFVIPRELAAPSAHTGTAVSPGGYLFTITCDTTNDPATAITVSVPFTVTTPQPSRFVGMATTVDGQGYWLVQSGGSVFSYGNAGFYGSLPGLGIVPTGQIVGMAATPDGKGYWLVAADGGVFSFGDAPFLGSMGDLPLDQPVVGMAPTPSGNGYWEVAADGTVYAFGDAHSLGGLHQQPNQPVVGIASTADGNGYWEVAADGGIFSFGDAQFHGSMAGQPLDRPVVGMSVDATTGGYWEAAADGGVFAFDAPYLGSTAGTRLNQPATGVAGGPAASGYRFVAADGGVFAFGHAGFFGSPG